jgi:hypothetical protein
MTQCQLLEKLRHGDRRSMAIDQDLRPLVRRHLRRALAKGTPAERARARKLLARSAA